MNILILTEGGASSGFGHLTRCLALAQALSSFGSRNAGRVRISFLVNGDSAAKTYIRDPRYVVTVKNWLTMKSQLLRLVEKFDMVIIDSYHAPKSLYDGIRSVLQSKGASAGLSRLVIFDDTQRIAYPPATIINTSLNSSSHFSRRSSDHHYLLGREYMLLRREFWRTPKKKINRQIKHVLITTGGVNHRELELEIIKTISEKYSWLHFHLINPQQGMRKVHRKNYPTTHFYPKLSAIKMRNLMLKCDLAISGGGQTTFELASVGLPAIGICFAQNQKLILEFWRKSGFMDLAGNRSDKQLFARMLTLLEKYRALSLRRNRSRRGRALVSGEKSARNLARLLLDK